MKKNMDGLIINVSSWSGNHVSLLSGVSYTSSKHALNAMTETINMKYLEQLKSLDLLRLPLHDFDQGLT